MARTFTMGLVCLALVVMSSERAGAAEPSSSTVRRLDFEDDVVSGEIAGAGDSVLDARRHRRGHLLIDVRKHFIPELLRSVDSL